MARRILSVVVLASLSVYAMTSNASPQCRQILRHLWDEPRGIPQAFHKAHRPALQDMLENGIATAEQLRSALVTHARQRNNKKAYDVIILSSEHGMKYFLLHRSRLGKSNWYNFSDLSPGIYDLDNGLILRVEDGEQGKKVTASTHDESHPDILHFSEHWFVTKYRAELEKMINQGLLTKSQFTKASVTKATNRGQGTTFDVMILPNPDGGHQFFAFTPKRVRKLFARFFTPGQWRDFTQLELGTYDLENGMTIDVQKSDQGNKLHVLTQVRLNKDIR